MEEYTSTRLAMQLIAEDLHNLLFHYHIGLEEPEFQAVDYSPEIMATMEQAHNTLKVACVYVNRINNLIEGSDTDDTYLMRLKDDLEAIEVVTKIEKPAETLNERTVREILEAEITHLQAENAALRATVALLEENNILNIA